ncbi:MAG TPA: hypothetical protein VKG38_11020 [Solirubrobacteraceae bacterium]|nr:hypothetical protein [Solirubrobacteraceae bacterium]
MAHRPDDVWYDDRPLELARDLEALGPLAKAAMLAGLALAVATALPQHDRARLLPGLDCSLVTEQEASRLLHAEVALEPSDGHLCRFASTEASQPGVALIVVARGANAGLPAGAVAPGERVRFLRGIGEHAVAYRDDLLVSQRGRSVLLELSDERDSEALRIECESSLGRLIAARL